MWVNRSIFWPQGGEINESQFWFLFVRAKSLNVSNNVVKPICHPSFFSERKFYHLSLEIPLNGAKELLVYLDLRWKVFQFYQNQWHFILFLYLNLIGQDSQPIRNNLLETFLSPICVWSWINKRDEPITFEFWKTVDDLEIFSNCFNFS